MYSIIHDNQGGSMTNEITQLEKISNLIESYLNSFGLARIGLYVFPCLENHYNFTRYLNAFMSALKRANSRPAYSWSFDSTRGCYNLIVIVSGYFRNDMNDVTERAQRIWNLYSPFPIQFIAEMPLCLETLVSDKLNLFDTMNRMPFVPSIQQRLLPSHQRAFACSKL